MEIPIDKVIRKRQKALAEKTYTLSELVDIAEEENLSWWWLKPW
jgi:hypothetical protein